MGLLQPIEGGGTLTQHFGPSWISVEPTMWYTADKKAYWNPYPGAHGLSENVHAGVDWSAPVGTPLRALEDGIVTASYFDKYNGGGWTVEIAIRGNTSYSLNHCDELLVHKVGRHVRKGLTLATLGCTGTIWTGKVFLPSCGGPHVHVNLIIREKGSDGIWRKMLYNVEPFLIGGPRAQDSRIKPLKP